MANEWQTRHLMLHESVRKWVSTGCQMTSLHFANQSDELLSVGLNTFSCGCCGFPFTHYKKTTSKYCKSFHWKRHITFLAYHSAPFPPPPPLPSAQPPAGDFASQLCLLWPSCTSRNRSPVVLISHISVPPGSLAGCSHPSIYLTNSSYLGPR